MKAVLAGLALALVLFFGLLAVQNHLQKQYERIEAYVASKDIPKGTDITKENVSEYFEKKEIMKTLVNGSSIRKEKQLYGCYAAVKIKKGTLVYTHDFRSDTEETRTIKNPVEMSVKLSGFSDGVSGTIRKGDYVLLYFTDKTSGEIAVEWTEPVYIKESFDGTGINIAPSDTQSAASVFTIVVAHEKSDELSECLKKYDVTMVRTETLTQNSDKKGRDSNE